MHNKQPFKKIYPERIRKLRQEELEEELTTIDSMLIKGNGERAKGQNPYSATDIAGSKKTIYDMKKLRYMKTTILTELKEREKNARTNNHQRR